MGKPLTAVLFAEDRGHEVFARAVIERLSRETNVPIDLRVVSARGGHGRALDELSQFQRLVHTGRVLTPDVLVVAIDGNGRGYVEAVNEIRSKLGPDLDGRAVVACPDPHIERWFMADPTSFHSVIGAIPKLGKRLPNRDTYKQLYAEAIKEGGQITLLGGLEFVPDLVAGMDYFRAGKIDAALRHFLSSLKEKVEALSSQD